MKFVYILGILACAAAVSALPIEEEQEHGKGGWYVPQADGSFVWMSTEEGAELLEALEQTAVENKVLKYGRASLLSDFIDPVGYYLYTNKNPTKPQKISDDAKSIRNSNFDPKNPTRFVIHGWRQSYKSKMNSDIRDAWLGRGNYNIIVLDWSRARDFQYILSVAAVQTTGKKLAKMIDTLVQNHGMNLGTTEVIGHSLGAHVAGYAGKNIASGKLHAIVGLDPASPLFKYHEPTKRLSSDDAVYVETIQTSGGKLGFLEPIGMGTFYPNGGKKQPGCGFDLTGQCSHERSCAYYAEAVAANNFVSVRCNDYEDALKDNCSGYRGVRMGAVSNAHMVTGNFYVPVHDKAPYAFV